ncbi:MAG: Mth938-like domain-containing protein [Acidobacteriota bacterium]
MLRVLGEGLSLRVDVAREGAMKITAYDFGRVDIEGKAYTSDVIIMPGKVKSDWWRKEGHRLRIEDLGDVVEAEPELLVVGTGYYGRMAIPAETRDYLESKGIKVHAARTGEAVQEFNRRRQEGWRIVAALHLTC